ncbi:MAG: hypothetical protein JWN76_3051 [Chitinophagaceae bacterium]|nr:hypothetical protein [Chitinophagaceae bacterium]
MKKWVLILSGVLLFGCEKDADISIDKQEQKLVVDAIIENLQAPVVILTKSIGYLNTVPAAEYANSFVHGAIITLSDGSKTMTLKEYSSKIDSVNKTWYYTIDSSNLVNAIFGAQGKTYQLLIKTGNDQYNASTTIPFLTKKMDSLWWKKAPQNPDSTKVIVISRVADPPGLGNYIRYFTKVNMAPFFPGLASVYDDQLVDGTVYDVQVDRGYDKNEKLKLSNDEFGYYKRGDTVTVKFTNIDKATYDFWRTWEYSYQSNGNPFSSPGKILGNISNNALGNFSGYAVQYKTLIIPK